MLRLSVIIMYIPIDVTFPSGKSMVHTFQHCVDMIFEQLIRFKTSQQQFQHNKDRDKICKKPKFDARNFQVSPVDRNRTQILRYYNYPVKANGCIRQCPIVFIAITEAMQQVVTQVQGHEMTVIEPGNMGQFFLNCNNQ